MNRLISRSDRDKFNINLEQFNELVSKYTDYKKKYLTLPTKQETLRALKYALSKMSEDEIKTFAKTFGVRTVDDSGVVMPIDDIKMDLIINIQHLIYGHAIKAWNRFARYGMLIALFYILNAAAEKTAGSDRFLAIQHIHHVTNLMILMLSLFGVKVVVDIMTYFSKSWKGRKQVFEELGKIHHLTEHLKKYWHKSHQSPVIEEDVIIDEAYGPENVIKEENFEEFEEFEEFE